MKRLYEKINELWARYRKWGESSIIGDFTVSTVKGVLVSVLVLFLFYSLFIVGPFRDEEKPSQESSLSDSGDTAKDDCSVFGVILHGDLLTYIPYHSENNSFFDDSVASDYIVDIIKQANEDAEIKAILIEVDSGGGSAVAGEEISDAVKNSDKPIVAIIRGIGASGAYWAISSADKIFASKNSDVGSIGVTSSYLSSVENNKKNGYVYEQLSVGKFKDSGDPDKPLTNEERSLFLRDINIIYENFIKAVSQNRKLSIADVRSFADGSTVLGEKAKSLGLIDEIGGMGEVEKYLEKTIGEKPEICWQ
ncbi:MAG: signal peptide peptidase SppA [Candidatus Levybacteria bacterium]|nr:signal peptide peptidase SppA [Candidatus Levybacteria bacterium]